MKRLYLLFLVFSLGLFLISCSPKNEEPLEFETVVRGNISPSIPSNGSVMPRNRVEIKPPVGGRVEAVLVAEGANVKKGEILAWISSNERATLLDAARAKGKEELKYWESVYKPAPIIAPLDGFIILRGVEPGQSVTVNDPVLVMADKLIVKAQVDETDLGKIKLNQKSMIQLDAYPDKNILGYIEHINYESQIINNVTIYQVDVIPNNVPQFFRSGMSATISFMSNGEKNILLLSSKAIRKNKGNSYVFVQKEGEEGPSSLQIEVGVESGDKVQIVSGLKEGDKVVIPTAKIVQEAFGRRRGGPINPFGGRR